MTVEELKVLISAETAGFNSAMDGVKGKLGDIAETGKGKLGMITNAAKGLGIAAAAGATAVAAACVKIGKEAFDAYKDYEQLSGGVNKLFGDDAAAMVEKNARAAFKSAGMSANEYMETITGFSASLISSLEGDTKKAASYADMAIRDMSDNANVFGTSMQSIQNAYQGFAKQNYSMLDNLKLGYGGTGKEMFRLMQDAAGLNEEFANTANFTIDSKGHLEAGYADIVRAIHIVQEAQHIEGTTAKEAAQTIEGSINMAKSAWTNFVAGLGNEKADMGQLSTDLVESLTTMAGNVIPRIGVIFSGITTAFPPLFVKAAQAIKAKAPQLIIGALNSIITAVPAQLGKLWNTLTQNASHGLSDLTANLQRSGGARLATLMQKLTEEMPAHIAQFFGKIKQDMPNKIAELKSFIQSRLLPFLSALANTAEAGLLPYVGKLIVKIIKYVPPMLENLLKAIVDNVPKLIIGAYTAITTLVPQMLKNLVGWIKTKLDEQFGSSPLFEGLVNSFSFFMDGVKSAAASITPIFTAIANAISSVVKFIVNLVSGVRGALTSQSAAIIIVKAACAALTVVLTGLGIAIRVVVAIFKTVIAVVSLVANLIKGRLYIAFKTLQIAVKLIIAAFKTYVAIVKAAAKAIVNTVKNQIAIFKALIKVAPTIAKSIPEAFNNAKNKVIATVNKMKSGLSNTFNSIKNTASSTFSKITRILTSPFTKAVSTIKSAISRMKSAVKFRWSLPKLRVPHVSVSGGTPPYGIGGKGSLPHFSVNWYAKGGVFDSPSVIGVGENGREAVMPLENNTGWIDELAAKLSDKSGDGSINITLAFDNTKFGKACIKSIKQAQKQTGAVVLAV